MSELGKAYIEVTADLKKFPAELRAKLKKAMAEGLAGVEFTGLEGKASKAGEKAATEVAHGFETKAKKEFEKSGEAGGRGLLAGLKRIFNRGSSEGKSFLSGLGGFFSSIFSTVGSTVASGVQSGSSATQAAGGQLSSLTSTIGSIGGGVGSALPIIGWSIAIPIIIQLAGALVQLSAAAFAIPAALGVAAGAIAPLIIAFQGFGEAVGAGLSGDVKKFDAALKGLPPSMRSVVREVVGLKSIFTGVKTAIQQAFFQPLVGVVGPAIRSFLAVVQPGLVKVAGSLGHIGASLLRTFSSPENLRTFAALLGTTNRIVQTLEPTITNLAQALLNLIQPALPFLERGATAFRDFAANLEKFTAGIGKSGQLTSWLDRAAHILGTLVTLAGQLGDYLITLLGGEIGDIGTKFLDDFKVKLQELIDYIKSPDGQESIHNLGVVLKFVGDVFLLLVGMEPAALRAFNGVFTAVRNLLAILQALGGGFVWLITKIGEFVVWLGEGIGHGFMVAYRAVWGFLKDAGSAIADFFTKDIPRWFGEAVDWFKSLPGKIMDAISGFRTAGRDFVMSTLESWYSAVFEQIGRIIGLFLALPYLVKTGWERSITFLADFFKAAWQFGVDAVHWGIDSTLAAIYAVPDLLAAAGSAIWGFFVDLGHTIASFFTDTIPNAFTASMAYIGDLLSGLWHDVVQRVQGIVSQGFDDVVSFITGLPGRIAALGPMIYHAAIGLGKKLAEGLSSIGNFATDIGRKVADALKSAINWVIGKINTGIADIDDKIPGTLPRIPTLARGAVVDSPTLALIGEAGPEVVVPLGDPNRARQLAEQSGLLSMLRGNSHSEVNVMVYLDPSGVIIPTIRTVVNGTLDEQGDELTYARAS